MDQYLDITKEIVLAMIQKGSIPFWGMPSDGDEVEVTTKNAKAVAAAFETVYAGVVDTIRKER